MSCSLGTNGHACTGHAADSDRRWQRLLQPLATSPGPTVADHKIAEQEHGAAQCSCQDSKSALNAARSLVGYCADAHRRSRQAGRPVAGHGRPGRPLQRRGHGALRPQEQEPAQARPKPAHSSLVVQMLTDTRDKLGGRWLVTADHGNGEGMVHGTPKSLLKLTPSQLTQAMLCRRSQTRWTSWGAGGW